MKKSSGGVTKYLLIIAAIVLLMALVGRSSDTSGSVILSTVGSILKVMIWGVVIIVILLIIFVVVVAVSATKNDKKPSSTTAANKKDDTEGLTEEQSAAIKKGGSNLLELRKKITNVKNQNIKNGCNDICLLFENTLNILKKKPNQISNARQCLNYYMPTFGEVLDKYLSLQNNNVLTDDMSEKLQTYLKDIRAALEKLNSKLFEDDKLDMSVEMEAMTLAFKRDGLLDDPGSMIDLKL